MKARILMAVVTITALLTAPFSYAADDTIGIFETVYATDVSFDETAAATGEIRQLVTAIPGVDHVAALPTDILVVREGSGTKVLHHGQMWRMQLYFWDSGYRAFTANVGVPSAIADSIEDTISAGD